MTDKPTFRSGIRDLVLLARAEGEADFAEFLREYNFALGEECRDGDECLQSAENMLEEARKLYRRFEGAAGNMNEDAA